MTAIPTRVYDSAGQMVLFDKGYKPKQDPLNRGDLRVMFCEKANRIRHPFIEMENNICAYGIIKDPTGCVIIIGPVMLRHMNEQEVRAYAQQRHVSGSGFSITTGSLLTLSATMALLFFARTGEKLPEISRMIDPLNNAASGIPLSENEVGLYMMQNVEDEIQYNEYRTEFLFLKQIQQGDVEGIAKEVDPNFNLHSVGRLASKPLKHFEHMICSSITLAARAAIEGGLDPATAYAMSDLYMQRLELCRSVNDFLIVQIEMKTAYAKQVRKAREARGKTSYVEKCKIFIDNHLNKPFEMDELAAELGINKSYLSRKFKEEMNMGVMRYTRLQRVQTAANMLKFSNEKISAIANHLCFSSQSHFGAVFKEFKGVSPQEYRDREQVVELKGRKD